MKLLGAGDAQRGARRALSRVVSGLRESRLARSLAMAALAALVVGLISGFLSEYRDLQLAYGGYYFVALAGLTVLVGLSGQVSLGHGAFMAVGAYTVVLLVGNEQWPLLAALLAAVGVSAVVGVAVGAAASRLRGPYLAGATLAFAVALPAIANRFPETLGGENGLTINPPAPPGFLGPGFSLERWEAWIACAGALVVAFLLQNLVQSGVGRSFRAVRDDEIAAALCGLRVSRVQIVAFISSAACAGLGGGLLAAVLQLAQPGAFTPQLSFFLLAGVVIGGLGSLWGALWGAAILVLLPNWTSDLAHAFSFSPQVSGNLPLAIYGVMLIVAMLAWPSGIQGGARALRVRLRGVLRARGATEP